MKAYLVENGQPVKQLRSVRVSEGLEQRDFIEFNIDLEAYPKVIGHEGIKPNDKTLQKLIIPVIRVKWRSEPSWYEERALGFESEEQRNLI